MRSFVAAAALALLCLGVFATVAASAELPLMPPLERVGTASEAAAAAAAAAPGMMSRLIRLYFGDQVRWWPFLDWSDHTHHRVVREYRRGGKLPEVVKYHLRGSPVEAPTARGGL